MCLANPPVDLVVAACMYVLLFYRLGFKIKHAHRVLLSVLKTCQVRTSDTASYSLALIPIGEILCCSKCFC